MSCAHVSHLIRDTCEKARVKSSLVKHVNRENAHINADERQKKKQMNTSNKRKWITNMSINRNCEELCFINCDIIQFSLYLVTISSIISFFCSNVVDYVY